MNKVEANLSLDKAGSFLTNDLYRIANNYNMAAFNAPFNPGMYIKKLSRKQRFQFEISILLYL